jgi:hypothetical protein
MMGRMRRPVAMSLAILGLQVVACGETRKLTCDESIAQRCATPGSCALTWDEARDDTRFCPSGSPLPAHRADCGSYHAITVNAVDTNTTYYYDVTSGRLVAIVQAGFGGTSCVAGPEDGFTRPICGGALSEELPQCLDGGADAAPTD